MQRIASWKMGNGRRHAVPSSFAHRIIGGPSAAKDCQPSAKSRSGGNGFTLIEAIISLAILGLTIAVMVEATSRCLAVIRISRNYHAARSVLEQGELEHPLVSTNDVQDNIVEPVDYDNGFTYSRDLQQSADEKDLYIVRSRVTWAELGKHSFEEVVSYCYCPEKK